MKINDWSVIKLRDDKETSLFNEQDEEDIKILDGFSTKKQAEEYVKNQKCLQKLSLIFGVQKYKYRFVIERTENI